MIFLKHIPYKLLDGSCILRTYGDPDIFGGRDAISECRLRKVRIELFYKKDVSINGDALFSCGRLFFDCRRSIPQDAVFSADGGCSVIIRGREFRVTEIRYHYARGIPVYIILELGGG